MLKSLRTKGAVKGFKRTPQRLAILDYLDGNTSHPSAEEIYAAVSKKHRSMSFATVYNTLHALVEAGALSDLKIDPERRRFDPNTQPHHHLICVACRKVVDVHEPVTVPVPPAVARECEIIGCHVEYKGYCPSCISRRGA